MFNTRNAVATDLQEVQAMVKGLENYLKGDELYGKAGGGFFSMPSMPSLTVGALLMRLQRLHVLRETLTDDQRTGLDQAIARHDAIRSEWRAHYDAKMQREALSRLRAMDTYFEELRDDPRTAANNYQPEALRRTISQVLFDTMRQAGLETGDVETAMNGVDSRLRRWIEKGDFIWAPELQAAYPESTYWWLYGRPRVPNR